MPIVAVHINTTTQHIYIPEYAEPVNDLSY